MRAKFYSIEEIIKIAPSVGARKPYKNVSKKYNFVSTVEVLKILYNRGWYAYEVVESQPRNSARIGYQKHMIRLRNTNMEKQYKEEIPEIVLVNSHDKSSAFSIMFGILRVICENGLVVGGNKFRDYKFIHRDYNKEAIELAIKDLEESIPKFMENINLLKSVRLSNRQMFEFALEAKKIRFPQEHYYVNPEEILKARRTEDEGNELWKVFNRVQENLIKGGFVIINKKTGKKRLSKKIKSPTSAIKINKNLFDLMIKYGEWVGNLKINKI